MRCQSSPFSPRLGVDDPGINNVYTAPGPAPPVRKMCPVMFVTCSPVSYVTEYEIGGVIDTTYEKERPASPAQVLEFRVLNLPK